ncbi:MAG: hypothetical protein KME04_00665 [Pleurocapsa minor GSE-CHR-MK-17-07R]|jgi:hypothetical protein|nr:hypothetical protein [Pleurocapsa minor GSE-CHR-MK 17-07R]
MPSLFDHINRELNDDDSKGITPLELAELPADQRQIMLAMLRDQAGQQDGVARAFLIDKWVGRVADVDGTLNQLVHMGLLIMMGETPNERYRVNLRHKRGSNAGFGLWSVLSDRVPKDRLT